MFDRKGIKMYKFKWLAVVIIIQDSGSLFHAGNVRLWGSFVTINPLYKELVVHTAFIDCRILPVWN